jgi:curved DNA-binding protein
MDPADEELPAVAVKFRDYYEVLGVARTAKPEDIKRAYRQLARKKHPDLAPQAERARATEHFKEINEAYEVLKDPKKRSRYDALGENWKNGMDYTPPPGARPGGAGESEWSGDVGDFSDFFSAIFGRGTGPPGRQGMRFKIPGQDIEAELPVTLEEVLKGGRRRIQISGGRTLDVEIPAGIRDGAMLRLAGQGEPGTGGALAGDVYLHVRLAAHSRYRPVGDDLEMDLPLWPWQAVLGAELRIETPDGPVTLKVPPATPAGRRLRLRGRGLPRAGGERGDLHAIVRITVPAEPTDAERAAYEALKSAAPAPADRPAQK